MNRQTDGRKDKQTLFYFSILQRCNEEPFSKLTKYKKVNEIRDLKG